MSIAIAIIYRKKDIINFFEKKNTAIKAAFNL